MSTANNSEIVPRLRLEWLDNNRLRSYPLDNSSDVPTPLFVDALFLNSQSIDSNRLYIKSIIKDGDNVNVFMAGYVNDTQTDFGLVASIPFDTAINARIPILKETADYLLAGTITIGDINCMNEAATVIELTEESGRLFPGCVRQTHETLLGIKVGDTTYTGIVTLVAGDGVEIDVMAGSELGETVITLSVSPDRIADDNTAIRNDAELLAAAIKAYGDPVRTICGVSPNPLGDITFAKPEIAPDEDDGEYITVTSASDGVISLAIANDTTDTRCTDNTNKVESIAKNLGSLNQRAGELDEILRALDEAVSNLSLQVSRG